MDLTLREFLETGIFSDLSEVLGKDFITLMKEKKFSCSFVNEALSLSLRSPKVKKLIASYYLIVFDSVLPLPLSRYVQDFQVHCCRSVISLFEKRDEKMLNPLCLVQMLVAMNKLEYRSGNPFNQDFDNTPT